MIDVVILLVLFTVIGSFGCAFAVGRSLKMRKERTLCGCGHSLAFHDDHLCYADPTCYCRRFTPQQ